MTKEMGNVDDQVDDIETDIVDGDVQLDKKSQIQYQWSLCSREWRDKEVIFILILDLVTTRHENE
eukprot:8321889-Ditylum_brightwellii.AAC.1